MLNFNDERYTWLYGEQDFSTAKAAKKNLLLVYFGIMSAVLTAAVLLFAFRNSIGARGWIRFINIVLTAGLFCFTLFFFSIKFRLTNKYARLLRGMSTGLIETDTGIFLRYEDGVTFKDGVDFRTFLSVEKVVKRNDFPERRIYVEAALAAPDFSIYDELEYLTHAGILIAYRVLKKGETIPF
ncbi:MAG: hypothetical protein FWE62_03405 [Firmicutes bacterium]|nr:hypothetical protein [Bacillota bacterium]